MNLEWNRFIFIIIMLMFNTVSAMGGGGQDDGADIIEFQSGYNLARAPVAPGGKPVTVFFRVFIQTVAPIRSTQMQYSINFRLTMSWTDRRLLVNLSEDADCDEPLMLSQQVQKRIWRPDPFIIGADAGMTSIKSLYHKLVNLHIFPDNSTLVETMIVNATVFCQMDFIYYPMDTQFCPLVIRSFSYREEQVRFRWMDSISFNVEPRQLIQFTVAKSPPPQHRELYYPYSGLMTSDKTPKPSFIQQLKADKMVVEINPVTPLYPAITTGLAGLPLVLSGWEVTALSGGNFSELRGTFRFERLVGSHLLQSFIPVSLIVSLSWFSFWLELEVTPARGSLLMTSILTLEIHYVGVQADLPPVSYMRAIDFWYGGSLLFLFAALAEFVLVKVVRSWAQEAYTLNRVYSIQKPHRVLWKQGTNQEEQGQMVIGGGHELYKKKRLGSAALSGRSVATIDLPLVETPCGCCCNLPLVWKSPTTPSHLLWKEIDNLSKWIFPISFLLFCIAYWTVLICHLPI